MIKKIIVFCIALSASALSQANLCRSLDFNELKEMKTNVLRTKVYEYLSRHNDFTVSYSPNRNEAKADQCEGEIEKMVDVLVKRKDLDKVRRTYSSGMCLNALCKKYDSVIGVLH